MKHKLKILYALIFSNTFVQLTFTLGRENATAVEFAEPKIYWVKLWDGWYARIPKILYYL